MVLDEGHGAKSITAVDAKTAQDNGFWEYVGNQPNTYYYKVNDFSLDCIKDDFIDLVFSALVFCHISPVLINEYLKNLYNKMRKGAQAFIMYADYDKYNQHYKKLGLRQTLVKENLEEIYHNNMGLKARWYHLGVDTMKRMLEEIGYVVINPDINVDHRDPIVHFTKPY